MRRIVFFTFAAVDLKTGFKQCRLEWLFVHTAVTIVSLRRGVLGISDGFSNKQGMQYFIFELERDFCLRYKSATLHQLM